MPCMRLGDSRSAGGVLTLVRGTTPGARCRHSAVEVTGEPVVPGRPDTVEQFTQLRTPRLAASRTTGEDVPGGRDGQDGTLAELRLETVPRFVEKHEADLEVAVEQERPDVVVLGRAQLLLIDV